MAWTVLTFPFGSLLTSVKVTQLSDNITALAAGDAGAPKIVTASMTINTINGDRILSASLPGGKLTNDTVTATQIGPNAVTVSELAAGAVHQGELNTSSGEVNTSTIARLTLPGGAYGFYPQVKHDTTTTTVTIQVYLRTSGAQGAYATLIYIDAGDSGSASAQQRYVNASAPYDLGDGEIPLFVFALVDAGGRVLASYAADAPPWAYNGPTWIGSDLVDKKGRRFQKRITNGEPSLIEVTQEIKNADMPLIPHPFNDVPEGCSVVLLDPVGTVVEKLAELHIAGESVADLLRTQLLLSSSPLLRKAPPGVAPVGVTWKNTKGQ